MSLMTASSEVSRWRGYEYFKAKRVSNVQKIGEARYSALVSGSENTPYSVTIDLDHVRQSSCTCPHAAGRRIICKHMIALDLGIFPEKEQQILDYIEEQNQLYEQEYEQEIQEREEEIVEYVMKLSKAELRQMLIQRMIDDLYY